MFTFKNKLKCKNIEKNDLLTLVEEYFESIVIEKKISTVLTLLKIVFYVISNTFKTYSYCTFF